MTATYCTCRQGRCEFGPCEFCQSRDDAEQTRLAFVASELLSTLQYLKREWERDGRIDAINMRHVYEALSLAQPDKRVAFQMAAE